MEIHELNEQGEYTPVEVQSREEMLTGGIFQLRQGQQRRIHVRVNPVQNSGTLPIICEAITSIAVGSVCVRSRLQKPLDSYQEEDLSVLREKWSDALMRRRQYLDRQIQRIVKKEGLSLCIQNTFKKNHFLINGCCYERQIFYVNSNKAVAKLTLIFLLS